MKFQFLNNA